MMSLGGRARPELGFSRPRAWRTLGWDLLRLCPPLRTPRSLPLTGTWDVGETFSDLLCAGTEYFGSTRQAPQRFTPAEGAEQECGRVGVCMSVDPERHTLTHTHSHARTHAGPSAAPPAPARTFTSRAAPSDPVPGAQPLPTRGTERDRQRRQGLPVTPRQLFPHPPVPAPARGRGEGERCPGLLPLRRPSARGSAAGSRPATSAGLAGTRPEGGLGAGQGGLAALPRPAAPPALPPWPGPGPERGGGPRTPSPRLRGSRMGVAAAFPTKHRKLGFSELRAAW